MSVARPARCCTSSAVWARSKTSATSRTRISSRARAERKAIMQANHQLGWLGTGRMGAAMAARLISDGAAVTVWNRTASKTTPLIEVGATQSEKISELGHCDIVFTSVSSSADLLEVTLGSEGLLDAQPAPGIVV